MQCGLKIDVPEGWVGMVLFDFGICNLKGMGWV